MSLDNLVQHLRAHPSPFSMGFIIFLSTGLDAAGDTAVVIEAVDCHTGHEGAGAPGELDGLPGMIGGVFADLAVDIVDGKEGVEPSTGSSGWDSDMEEVEGEVGDPAEGSGISGMFVGVEHLSDNSFHDKTIGKILCEVPHRFLDPFRVSFRSRVQTIPPLSLFLCHPSLPAQYRKAQFVDELGG